MFYLMLILLVSGCITAQVVDNSSMNIPATTAVNSTTTTALISNITSTAINIPNNPINISITGINPKEEWIEIKNNGEDADITSWTIADSANHKYTFAGVLLSNTTLKLHSEMGTDNSTDVYWGYRIAVWNDDGDTATLTASNETVIHVYNYSKSDSPKTTSTSTASTTITSTVTSSTTAPTTSATSTIPATTTTIPQLSASIDALPQILVRGNYINITVFVSSGGPIDNTTVFTKITYASGINQTNSNITNQTGHYVWRKLIGGNSKTGTFYVESGIIKDGYENATVNTSFDVVSA